MENKKNNQWPLIGSALVSIIFIGGSWVYVRGNQNEINNKNVNNLSAINQQDSLEEQVIPKEGIEFPITWNDLGKKLIEAGVIDANKFEGVYAKRGGIDQKTKELLYSNNNQKVVITRENSAVLLNLFWALGLSNKNEILESGPMADKRYGKASNYASTGGWTLAKGDAMNHFSKHEFIKLTPEQQSLVALVSKNIYRPCCDNSTYFPDCNHGMAMLGLLELAASQGVSQGDLYKIALVANSYWFSDNYITIAKYFKAKGVSWDKVNASQILSRDFSSASGYQNILSKVEPVEKNNNGGCGV